ncbi:MAG: ABC transporter ATP-binding protein [Bdellovibrionaceae bacterium]|nr:ABC transporter ATP-binding protein [Bdellovibrionales bacterium]MCB9254298.1 ABC transporter ATP-binding protein [Pseudobdellovibrionaceae bacterium]
MSILLSATGLKKTFYPDVGVPPIDVLDGLDFDLHERERVAVVGKSGAGKSTFLHIMGTLEAPTMGRVLFEGKDVFKLDDNRLSAFRNQKLGFVFQFHYLMLEFNALENVMMPALLHGESTSKAKRRARDLLFRVGLSERMYHKPGQLSGGEQQRVAVARALMMQPKLLLTDEMTGNLDPATGDKVMNLVLSLQEEFGMAMVSVTHDEGLANTFPRVLHLVSGRLSTVP